MNEKEQVAADLFLNVMASRGTAIDTAKTLAEAYAALMEGYRHRVMADRADVLEYNDKKHS